MFCTQLHMTFTWKIYFLVFIVVIYFGVYGAPQSRKAEHLGGGETRILNLCYLAVITKYRKGYWIKSTENQKPRRRLAVNTDNIAATSVAKPAPKIFGFGRCRRECDYFVCQHTAYIYIYPVDVTLISPPKGIALTKQGAIIISRDKLMSTTLMSRIKSI